MIFFIPVSECSAQNRMQESNLLAFEKWSSNQFWTDWDNDLILDRVLLIANSFMSFFILHLLFSSVQFSCSVLSDSLRLHELQHARPPCPSPNPEVYPNSCPSSRWCHPAICPLLLPPIPPNIRVFSNESTLCMRWPKYWSFSFSIIPSKEHPGLISFRRDWLDLLAVQGTLKSLLQHHSSKTFTITSGCTRLFLCFIMLK